MTEQEIYIEAMSRQDPVDRCRFLDEACGDDEVLRNRLKKLIRHADDVGSFLEDPPHPLVAAAEISFVTEGPGTAIGPYKIREQIGEGGMGAVYVAEQTEPVRRKVALKIIKAGMVTEDVVARFEAERQALAMMEHPNIAKVLDAGSTETGRPYFVMELVRGIPITEYGEQARLSTQGRLDLFITVCHAIQHAHQKGVIHRDIKPSNVLVTLHDGIPVAKVIDFGIAKATQSELTEKTIYTQFQQFIGTPAYMSPEQAEMSGLDIDTRSDIYSLGVLIYELLTGVTPFDANELKRSGLDEMRKIICEREPLRPSSRRTQECETVNADSSTDFTRRIPHSAIDRDLDWIVMKCLEKDRTRRYATASGLAADLKRHLANEPVVARPPSAAYRFQKAFRRNRIVFVTVALVTTSLITGIGVSTWQALAARTAQQKAQSAQQTSEDESQRADAQARRASKSERQARRLQYASDINLAQQSLISQNNLDKARRLLDRHRPQPGEEDLRGWEWRYLWQLTRSNAVATLTKRSARCYSMSFSPDGTRLAVGWSDGRVELWDVPGRCLDRVVREVPDRPRPHSDRVAFSPVRNLLAVTSGTKGVALHDLDSGREAILWQAPDDTILHVNDFSFSQDGSRVVICAATATENADVNKRNVAVWVVTVSSSNFEGPYRTVDGTARLSPDHRHLFLAGRDTSPSRPAPGQGSSHYGYIRCIELSTGAELWKTEPVRDLGVSALDISPNGRALASGSGVDDSTIRVWDAETGQPLQRLVGHTGGVSKIAFARDGRRLISAASQTIRVWETDTVDWEQTQRLRGHTDAITAIAVSTTEQVFASVGTDGKLMLWKEDEPHEKEGYIRLPAEELDNVRELNMERSRLLLLPATKAPELIDLEDDAAAVPLPEIGSSEHVLGYTGSWSGSDLVCHWDGNSQILVHELRGGKLVPLGAIALQSAARPKSLIYNAEQQLLAWTEEASPMSVYVASLAAPDRRIELKSDVPNIFLWRFSEDGRFLTGPTEPQDAARVWDVETGQIVASIDQKGWDLDFAAGGRVMVASFEHGRDHEVVFFDLRNAAQPPRRVPGRYGSRMLAVSPDGGLVACATLGGQVRLFDPVKGVAVGSPIHGHLNAAWGVAFSPDARRLISTGSGGEAVKLWDVSTRQELMTLGGEGGYLYWARWMADGNVILVGAPWQAWRAPSWEEIEAVEKAEAID